MRDCDNYDGCHLYPPPNYPLMYFNCTVNLRNKDNFFVDKFDIERVISTIKPKLPDYVAKGMAAIKIAIVNREMLRCGRTPQ